jgi:GTPase SAR1 family protein
MANISGELLGNVKLLILGAKGSGKTLLAEMLVHGNPDVVEVGEWVDSPGLGRALFAETRMDGETMGAPGNVRLVEVAGFDQTDDVSLRGRRSIAIE